MKKNRIVVVCPGRGSYSRETSNYFKRANNDSLKNISKMDKLRQKNNELTLTELDATSFRSKIHLPGENASSLIYACSMIDYLSIDQEKNDIVAITGNSMGWYIALALSGALDFTNGFNLINIMGSMMKEDIIGGQIIYPIIDKNWRTDKTREALVLKALKNAGAYVSIYLGGYVVIGGDKDALKSIIKTLPRLDDYPLQIPFHGAFHTPLMKSIAKRANVIFEDSIFNMPKIPIIDGQGKAWSPYSSNINELYHYTLNKQVVEPYDFTSSISVAIKEFCPDKIVLLGPGNTLGGSIAQILIKNNWEGINSKESFVQYQKKDPFLISMGFENQREILLA